ncbi:hypothetical protein MMC25_002570 [Agyrium rufum]|nr:hypothetical protein [Agyrium rufum]
MGKPNANPQRRLPVQQLTVLAIARFAEPVALTSVFPYLPEMIESFNIPKKDIAKWAGFLSAVFSLSQCVTGIFWGRLSDKIGRKPTILAGISTTMIASLLFGFSQSLPWAICARALGGVANGNVGTIRTTVAELVPYKELQPKAFSVMPLVWTIGSIFGPTLGGALANPAPRYRLFDNWFFRKYPFALPNLVAAVFFFVGLSSGLLFLKETLDTKKDRKDYGRIVGKKLVRVFKGGMKPQRPRWRSSELDEAAPLRSASYDSNSSTLNSYSTFTDKKTTKAKKQAPPSYREVFSEQSSINLLTYALLALHSVAYDQLLPVFMHLPVQPIDSPDVKLPFKFAGGFGIDSERIGTLFTLYGVAGMIIQFGIFPPVARRYGVLNCFKACSVLFPIAYCLTPFAALMPTTSTKEAYMFGVMMLKCFAAIFSFPCSTILLTNSAGSLRLLGTLNGVAVSLGAIGRGSGPTIGGLSFSIGIDKGYIILPWFVLAMFAILGAIPIWWLKELDGFGVAKDSDSENSNDSSDQDEDDEYDSYSSSASDDEFDDGEITPPNASRSPTNGKMPQSSLANADRMLRKSKSLHPHFSPGSFIDEKQDHPAATLADPEKEAPPSDSEIPSRKPHEQPNHHHHHHHHHHHGSEHRLRHSASFDSVRGIRRIESPLGIRDPVGPGNASDYSTKIGLSNGFGQRTEGFGAGGTSYQA